MFYSSVISKALIGFVVIKVKLFLENSKRFLFVLFLLLPVLQVSGDVVLPEDCVIKEVLAKGYSNFEFLSEDSVCVDYTDRVGNTERVCGNHVPTAWIATIDEGSFGPSFSLFELKHELRKSFSLQNCRIAEFHSR